MGSALLAFATTPVVTVTSPANGSTDSSPVNFIASASSPDCAKGIAAMRIYTAPRVGAYTTDSDSLNVDLNLGAGTYDTVVQAWDNCGGVGKTPVAITVKGDTLAPPKFLYSSDSAGNKIYEYLVNASTGELTATTQGTISTPAAPGRIASDHGGFRLYVTIAAKSGSELSAYFINRSNGSLQTVPGSAGSLGTGLPTAVVVHPSGGFVYVTTTVGGQFLANYIYAFKVNSNGSLTAVSGSPFSAKDWQQQAVIDPTGSYLYTASYYTGSNVEAFDINKSTGALTPMAGEPFALPDQQSNCASGAWDMAFAQNGQHLVVPEYCDGVIAVFNVGSNGTLTSAPGSPVIDPPPGGTVDLQAIAVDPLNRWWYLYEFFPNQIPSMDVATLTTQDTAERNPASNCGDIIRADPSGRFVYAIGNMTGSGVCGEAPGAILGFSVNQSNGTLTALPGSPFPSPNADYSDEDGLVITQ
jgi:6-phosphogluconolactonase (cycloisomerase 2 family)